MRIPATIIATLKLAAVLVVVLATFGQAARFAHRPPLTAGDGLDPAAARSATPGFQVKGHITGLYPGTHRTLVAKVHNPNGFAIVVRSLGARLQGVHGCAAGTIKIDRFKGRKRIGRRSTVKIKLALRMKAKAPDGCQGAKLGIVYRGKAVQA